MRSRAKITGLGLILLIGAVAAGIAASIGAGLPLTTNMADPAVMIAVFRGDTLNDLTRLLRPMSFSVSGNTRLYLRDAIYAGAVNGRARVLTVWLTQDSSDNSLLLTAGDAAKQLGAVADTLAQGPLAGSTFAVLPVEVVWQDWAVITSRAGVALVKGPPATSAQLRSAISSAPTVLGRRKQDHSRSRSASERTR